MSVKLQDFTQSIHFTPCVKEKDYKILQHYIAFAKTMGALTYQSIYLIDYFKKGFLYVSNNQVFLCGNTPEKVLEEGYAHYLKNIPEKDLKMLLKINETCFSFFNGLPAEDRLKYTVSYNFHLKQPRGLPLLVNHKLSLLNLDKDSNPWIALCIISLSSRKEPGHVFALSNELEKYFQLDVKNSEWHPINRIELNNREREILQYSIQGYLINQIAQKLEVSIDTVKFHRKNIFSKLVVKNITEALAVAMDLSLV